jgi:hypothetical protein
MMKLHSPVRLALPLALACAAAASAQQLIGYVPKNDATVVGATDELDGREVLAGSVSVTAKDHTAPIALSRGGTVRVCQTSQLHITESRAMEVAAPLLFSLDRGAIEIQTNGTPTDAIMTPDLRLTVRNAGPLDLRLRVARNGDTCVENRGVGAPTIAVSDPFGESMYELPPNQHVLFEHGSVKEVVDHETTPCGCPDEKGMTVADALIAANTTAKVSPKTGSGGNGTQPPPAEAHPFPAAISEGLAPPETAAPAPATPGPPPPLTDAFVYNGVTKDPDAIPPQDALPGTRPPAPAPTPAVVQAPPPQPAPQVVVAAPVPQPAPAPPPPAKQPEVAQQKPQDVVGFVSHFFHKLFGHH